MTNDARYLESTKTPPSLDTAGLTTRGQEVKAVRATVQARTALAVTTLAASLAPGDAAEGIEWNLYPDRATGASAALVLVGTLAVLAVSTLIWLILRWKPRMRASAGSTGRTPTSMTPREQVPVNDNEVERENGWSVLNGDDDNNHNGADDDDKAARPSPRLALVISSLAKFAD